MTPTPFPTSVCHGCRFLREVQTGRSCFLRCQQGTPPKYPPQPVVRCVWREPASP